MAAADRKAVGAAVRAQQRRRLLRPHAAQNLLDARRIGSAAFGAAGVVAPVGQGPDGLHAVGVTGRARRHVAASTEGRLDRQAGAGELARVDLHQAQVDGAALCQ